MWKAVGNVRGIGGEKRSDLKGRGRFGYGICKVRARPRNTAIQELPGSESCIEAVLSFVKGTGYR